MTLVPVNWESEKRRQGCSIGNIRFDLNDIWNRIDAKHGEYVQEGPSRSGQELRQPNSSWDRNVSSIDSKRVEKDYIFWQHQHQYSSPRTRLTVNFYSYLSKQPAKSGTKLYGKYMTDVRFNGRIYQAVCSSNVKQIVDEGIGAVISPVGCGAAPVQVDEVAIGPSTEKQLKPMVALDNGKLLMKTVDMRPTAHEAAVSQQRWMSLRNLA
ncbi:hypothetical protein BBK36DRAFT_1144972 [Trichoderma citrinoviride]|uniref:Uncharacterized protein n=1 Tax=Trichoderma citrinoviride TaxID=58853 RepID=A0A2T4AYM8_9HYPO|nr:hypothetical protein BBK36DRAFT_1144972 [Trichoderma citrinoviride]PTB62179.1 hypothetical protein BBK36DRAFT_1144972 [Trichoderma citrinoviride]